MSIFLERRVLGGTTEKHYSQRILKVNGPCLGIHVEEQPVTESKNDVHFGTLGTSAEDDDAHILRQRKQIH